MTKTNETATINVTDLTAVTNTVADYEKAKQMTMNLTAKTCQDNQSVRTVVATTNNKMVELRYAPKKVKITDISTIS